MREGLTSVERRPCGHEPRAYVAINHEGAAPTHTFQTSLPAGEYCDVQSGKGVTVDGAGRFTTTLGANTAVALHVGAHPRAGGTDPGDPDPVTSGVSFAGNVTWESGANRTATVNSTKIGLNDTWHN